MLFAFGQRIEQSDSRFYVIGIRGKGFAIQIARLLWLLKIKVSRGRVRLCVSGNCYVARRQSLIQRNGVVHSIAHAQRADAVESKLAFGRG